MRPCIRTRPRGRHSEPLDGLCSPSHFYSETRWITPNRSIDVSEVEALFSVLRQSADADCVAAIERSVREAPDRALCRINVLDFAAKHRLDEQRTIAAFLHATRLGVFELLWSVLCPACGGVLDASATLKT